jgi:hypothetical protein
MLWVFAQSPGLPDARQQAITHLPGVFSVTSQLSLQKTILEGCAEDEQNRA